MSTLLEQHLGAIVMRLIREISAIDLPEGLSAESAAADFNMASAHGQQSLWQVEVRRLGDGGANG